MNNKILSILLCFILLATVFQNHTEAVKLQLKLKLRNTLFNNDFSFTSAINELGGVDCFSDCNHNIRYVLAVLYFQSDPKKAESVFKQVLEAKKDHAPSFYHLGLIKYVDGKIDEAIKYFQTAIKYDNKVSLYYNSLAWVYLEKENLQKALNVYEEGIKNVGNNDSLYFNKSLALSWYFKDRTEGIIENMVKALEISPNDEEYLLLLGFTYLKIKNFKDARSTLTRLLRVNPNDIYAILGVATTYKETGEIEKAIEIAKTALEIEPDNKVVLEELKEYESELEKQKKEK